MSVDDLPEMRALPRAVMEDEWASIRARRKAGGEALDRGTVQDLSDLVRPGPDGDRIHLSRADLVGVCLSGGGIRSGAYNLGILQGLDEIGALRHVDYVSTVSGGGFTGSAWSALSRDPSQPAFPLRDDAPALEHLRAHASYLALHDEARVLSATRFGVSQLRGVIVQGLLLAPIPVAIGMVLAMWHAWMPSSLPIPGLHIDNGLPFTTAAALGMLAAFVLSPVIRAVLPISSTPWSRRHRATNRFAFGALMMAAVAFIELQVPFLRFIHDEVLSGNITTVLLGSAVATATAASGFGSWIIDFAKGHIATIGLAVAAALAALLPGTVYLLTADHLLHVVDWPASGLAPPPFFWAGLALWFLLALTVDVNDTSGHPHWRDSISRAFLFATSAGADLASADRVPLSTLSPPGSAAPYHLINTTVNLAAAADPWTRRRNGDFFLLSRHWVGSRETGYVRTEDLERADPHLDSATATAISSAAASSNAGVYSSPAVAALLTTLNLRLGYWLPNPAFVQEQDHTRLYWRPGPAYLLREYTSAMRGDTRLVHVSDGGHIENLGLYELLRRRARYIIVGDAGADPGGTFGSLATAMRYARLDLGIEIDLNVDDMRPDAQGVSRRRAAVGLVRYPATATQPAELGCIVYTRLSVTGGEDETIREYRATHPDFPHESTGDQLFDIDQFEAYRSLGRDIIRSLADVRYTSDGPETGEMSFDDLTGWFLRLLTRLAPLDPEVPVVAHADGVPPEVAERLTAMRGLFHTLGLEEARARSAPKNQGAMNQLHQWAADPDLRLYYADLAPLFAESFQAFCEHALGLPMVIGWEQIDEDQLVDSGLVDAPEEHEGPGTWAWARLGARQTPVGWGWVAETEAGRELVALHQRPGFEGLRLRRAMLRALRDAPRDADDGTTTVPHHFAHRPESDAALGGVTLREPVDGGLDDLLEQPR